MTAFTGSLNSLRTDRFAFVAFTLAWSAGLLVALIGWGLSATVTLPKVADSGDLNFWMNPDGLAVAYGHVNRELTPGQPVRLRYKGMTLPARVLQAERLWTDKGPLVEFAVELPKGTTLPVLSSQKVQSTIEIEGESDESTPASLLMRVVHGSQ